MARLNAYDLPRIERPVETRTFEKDGAPFTLTLTPPDAIDKMACEQACEELCLLFLAGGPDREPAALPYPEVKPSRPLFRMAALMQECQRPEDEADRYPALEVIGLAARRPRDWVAVQEWFGSLILRWETERPN